MFANFEHPKMSNNNNNNTTRVNQSTNRNQNSTTRRQWTHRSNFTKKNQKNTAFTPPEWVCKESGNHVFITGPSAPTKCQKTKQAIINHITKEMMNAEEIKWALKHEEECNCNEEAPKVKDKEGKSITIDTTTAAGL